MTDVRMGGTCGKLSRTHTLWTQFCPQLLGTLSPNNTACIPASQLVQDVLLLMGPWNPAGTHQLRLVVEFPFTGFQHHPRWFSRRISAINSPSTEWLLDSLSFLLDCDASISTNFDARYRRDNHIKPSEWIGVVTIDTVFSRQVT